MGRPARKPYRNKWRSRKQPSFIIGMAESDEERQERLKTEEASRKLKDAANLIPEKPLISGLQFVGSANPCVVNDGLGAVSCNQHGPLHGGYDWDNEENKAKWQGLFSGHGKGTESPLEKVLEKVERNLLQDPKAVPNHSSGQLKAVPEALEYVESLLLKLLAMLTAKPLPASKVDVEVTTFSLYIHVY